MKLFIMLCLCASLFGGVRTELAIIQSVDGAQIIIETQDGNLWEVNQEGFTEKDLVEVTFYDCGTADKVDDVVVNISALAH